MQLDTKKRKKSNWYKRVSSSVIWVCYLFVLFEFVRFNPDFIFWFLVWLKLEMYLKLHISLSYIWPKIMRVKCISTCTHACIIIYPYNVPLFQLNIVILYWQSPLEYLVACFSRQLSSLPGPKTLFLDRYYFHPRGCVCLCVRLYIDYLKKFLTDFDETWQDDL